MKSSAEWKKIEIISQEYENVDDIYYEIAIFHDGKKDPKHIARYHDVNELMNISLGEVIAEYINNYL